MTITISTDQDNVDLLTELYEFVDEFMKTFQPVFERKLLEENRQRPFCRLSITEIMTILIAWQMIGGESFKQFYTKVILQYHKPEFPNLVSYSRFVEVAPVATFPLIALLQFQKEMSQHTGIYFVDSMKLVACHNLRIKQHKVFKDLAERGKSSTGWFYGFKLHLVINHLGEIMSVHITAGNIDDRVPVPSMVKKLKGKMFGDKGYIKKLLQEQLFQQGLELITKVKKNMKQKFLPLFDKLMLRKRAVIESVNDLLQNHIQIEHSRHRSMGGFMNNLLAGLIAYTLYPCKPQIRTIKNIKKEILHPPLLTEK